ncbi:MAG: TlpA family protein disulfide reductase [Chitinophagaceae bacterium]|nr:TlpA family protein disulfide reductase [Chitinophagaceae bacterium]
MKKLFLFFLVAILANLKSTGQVGTLLKLYGDNLENLSYWRYNCYDYISGIKRNNNEEQQLKTSTLHFNNNSTERYCLGGLYFVIEPGDTVSLNIVKSQFDIKCDVALSKYPGNYLWPFEIQKIKQFYSNAQEDYKNDISRFVEKVNEIYDNSKMNLQQLSRKSKMSKNAYQIYFSELKYFYYNIITTASLENNNSENATLNAIISEFNFDKFNSEQLIENSPIFGQSLLRYFLTISVPEKNPTYLDSNFFGKQLIKAKSFSSNKVKDFLFGKLLQYYFFMKFNMHDDVSALEEYKNDIIKSLTDNKILLQFFAYEKEYANYKIDEELTKEINLITITGEKKSLFEIIKSNKNKVTYVDYWATWCGPCLHEIPYLQVINKRFLDTINIVTISFDANYSKWEKYANIKLMPFSNYCIQDSISEDRLRKLFEMRAIPRSILFGKNGTVASMYALSPSTQSGIVTQIENLLKEK